MIYLPKAVVASHVTQAQEGKGQIRIIYYRYTVNRQSADAGYRHRRSD